MRLLLLSILLVSIPNLTFAKSKDESPIPTISEYHIEKVTVIEAVRMLNKLIVEQHPNKPELQVLYLPTPHGKGHDQKIISLQLINNPPISVVLDQLAQLSSSRYIKEGSRFILCDWTRS